MKYSMKDPGMQSIGYKELYEYTNGTSTQEQASERWAQKEIHYAKRQYTFMKKDFHIRWEAVDTTFDSE